MVSYAIRLYKKKLLKNIIQAILSVCSFYKFCFIWMIGFFDDKF